MKNFIILNIVVLALLFIVSTSSFAAVNVIYVNGIKNTEEATRKSAIRIWEILTTSENHSGDDKKSFSVRYIWNPVGFSGEEAYFKSEFKQDRQELFLLKTAEERYGEDFQKIMVPFNKGRPVDMDAAVRVSAYLDDMTPGSNSLEAEDDVTDEDMSGTQIATQGIVSTVLELGSAVVVAHSQGNLLANLAYAKIVSEFGDDASKMIRVVNVANTSEFSVNSLNFTHAGDEALYSVGFPDYSLETLPDDWDTWRVTPKCDNSDCNFIMSPPTFEASWGEASDPINHYFVKTYLSEKNVVLGDNIEGVAFTPGAERFVDRFEDFVYAAAESLESPPLVVSVDVPTNLVAVHDVYENALFVEWEGSGDVDGFEVRVIGMDGSGFAYDDTFSYAWNVSSADLVVEDLAIDEVWVRAVFGGEFGDWVKTSDVEVVESPVVDYFKTVVGAVEVGDGSIKITASGNYAYTMNIDNFLFSVIRLSDLTVMNINVQLSGWVEDVAIIDNYIYAVAMNGWLHVIDISTQTLIDTIRVGSNSHGIAISGNHAYMTGRSSSGNGIISVINLSTRTVVDTIEIGNDYAPWDIAILGDNAYITGTYEESVVLAVNLSTRTVVDTIDVGGNYPRLAVISGDYVHILHRDDKSSISLIRLSDRAVMDSISVYHASSIAISGDYIYEINYWADSVSVISLSTRTVVDTIDTGKGSSDIIVLGNYVYIMNSLDGTIIILSY